MNILIGTPAYNSMVHTDHEHSLISYFKAKISITLMTIGNESLIPRGRNSIISFFYSQKSLTHLFFLDGDIYLDSSGLLKLLSHNKDIIAAPVALKGYNKSGNTVYNVGKMLEDCGNGLYKVDKVGTAVMILSRKAVEALVNNAIKDNEIYYENPNSRGNSPVGIPQYDIFKTGVFDSEYYSEDYYICKVLMRLGFDIFLDETVRAKHNGMYVFE